MTIVPLFVPIRPSADTLRACGRAMTKQPAPHPTLLTPRLRLRQFRAEDTDVMHACFTKPEAMQFWDSQVHKRRTETERALRTFIKCTPSSYLVWAVGRRRDRWLPGPDQLS